MTSGSVAGEPSRSGAQAGAPLRVALVGAGYVARFHLQALREVPSARLVAIHDRDAGRAAALARAAGVRAVAALEDLVGQGVEVAHVLVPPDEHAAVVRRLLALGIGVFVEKPLVPSSREALTLGELAAARELPLGVNHNATWEPAFRRLLACVADGRLGRLEHVQVTWSVALPQLSAGDHGHWMFRQPSHILLEQAVHPCAQLHALLGPVEAATATVLATRPLLTGAALPSRWSAAFRAAGGSGELHLSFAGELPRAVVRVLGSEGVAEADLLRDTVTWEVSTPWPAAWDGFLAGWRRGGQLRQEACRGLLRYARHLLGAGGRSDPFFAGMRRSIGAFYERLAAGERVADAGTAAAVLEWCEAIAAAVGPQPLGAAPAPPAGAPRRGEIVVLGGAGFLGRPLVQRLLAAGHPVTLTSRRGVLPASLRAAAEDGRLRVLAARLEDHESLVTALAGAGTVLHLATGGGETWEEVERAMVAGTVATAEAALAAGVARFVYVSSVAALYAAPRRGLREVRDDHPLDPRPQERDLYSRGKIAAEAALWRLHRERGLPLVVARPGIVLGPGAPLQHAGLGYWVQASHCVGWGGGDGPLPLVSVADAADGLAAIATHPGDELHGRAVNLCARVPLSAAQVVAALRRTSGRQLRYHPRPLWLSQLLEIGKWTLKRIGGRRAPWPAYRDLAARAYGVPFASETARGVLGWRPTEEPAAFLLQLAGSDGGEPG